MLSAWMRRWRYRDWAPLAAVAVSVCLLVFFLVGAYRKAGRPGGYDVHCFLTAARAVRAGLDPYRVAMPIPYNYPLLPCTAAIPLTFLPESVVHALWFLGSILAWLGALVLIVSRWTRFTDVGRDRGLLVPLLAGSLLLLGPIQNHLLNGQTDALVLLVCVLFWIDYHEDRPRRAAFWLGLGVSLKLVPALFFVPLLLRRSWPTLTRAVAWIVVLSVLLPALFLGSGVVSAYAVYSRDLLLSELRSSAHSLRYPHCYTVLGTLIQLVPAWKTALAVRIAAALLVVIPLGLVAGRGRLTPWRRLAHLEAYLAAILLLSPLSQPHHLTLLLPCVWLLALRLLALPNRAPWAELVALAPFALFPLWKVLGGPLELVAVAWLFVAALVRASGLGSEERLLPALPGTADVEMRPISAPGGETHPLPAEAVAENVRPRSMPAV